MENKKKRRGMLAVLLGLVLTVCGGALTLTVGGSTGDGGRYVTLNGDATIYRMEETGLAQVLTLAALGLS